MGREAKEHAAHTGGGALLPFPGDTEHQLDATCPLCAHVDRETGLITAPVLPSLPGSFQPAFDASRPAPTLTGRTQGRLLLLMPGVCAWRNVANPYSGSEPNESLQRWKEAAYLGAC